jgi:hypothetical protein
VFEGADTTGSPPAISFLFLDCGPVGVPVTDANELIARAKIQIKSTPVSDGKGGTVHVDDYRFVPFGQGAGMLALATAAEVENEADVREASGRALWVRLDTTTPEGAIVASELISRAAVVVRR